MMTKNKQTARTAQVERLSKETQISITVDLDGSKERHIDTPLPFFSHMLDAMACHGRFGLTIKAAGDIEVDPHHLMEDTGIVLGQAIFKALGGLSGIERTASFTFPMDGSLVTVALDICGRRNLTWNVKFGNFTIGNIDPNLFKEFFKGLADGSRTTIHANEHYGDNDHHVIEAVFKAYGRSLNMAVKRLDDSAPLSTKGMFDEE